MSHFVRATTHKSISRIFWGKNTFVSSDHSHVHEKEKEIWQMESAKAKEAGNGLNGVNGLNGAAVSESTVPKEKQLLITIRSVVIVLALSIHSIFEGMAIG